MAPVDDPETAGPFLKAGGMTPEIPHQSAAIPADDSGAMGEEGITLDDLVGDEPRTVAASG